MYLWLQINFKFLFYTKIAKTIVQFKTLISFLIKKEDNLINRERLQPYSMSFFALMSTNFDFSFDVEFSNPLVPIYL